MSGKCLLRPPVCKGGCRVQNAVCAGRGSFHAECARGTKAPANQCRRQRPFKCHTWCASVRCTSARKLVKRACFAFLPNSVKCAAVPSCSGPQELSLNYQQCFCQICVLLHNVHTFASRTVHAVNGDRTAAELAAKLLPESAPASTSNEPQPQTPSLTPSGEALYPLPPGSTVASMSEAGAGGGAALADTGPISPFEHVMLDTALQVGTCLPAHSRSAVCLMPEHTA